MNRISLQSFKILALGLALALPAGLGAVSAETRGSGIVPAGAQQPKDWSEIRGTWSGIQKPRQIVVEDQAAWQALWAEHARGSGQESQAPAVDFNRETVVGVFLGARPKSEPVNIRVEPAGNGRVVINYKEGRPLGQYGITVLCQPFEIKKFPKAHVVKIEKTASAATPVAPEVAVAAAPETGLRDAVAKAGAKLRNVFGLRGGDSTAGFDTAAAGTLAGPTLVSGKAKPQASLLQLPPPPGQKKEEKEQGGLPPPPGQQNPQNGRRDQGGALPPPPGQGNGALPPPPGRDGNLPPPPAYRPRPGDSGKLPPPPGSGVPSDENGATVAGYWHVYRDSFGFAQERYGSWQQEDVAANIRRGGSETGLGQGTRYTADLESREFRRRYILYWRWVGYDCDPNDSDRCARWEREWRWFYEDTKYSRPRRMQAVVEFDRDQPLLAWEKETIRAHYDGSRVWIEYSDPSFKYQERGPIIDQQNGTATISLTPTSRILRSPEREKVTAYLIKEGGRLKLVVEDARTREYAGESLEIEFQVYREEKASWRNPFGRDTKVAERTSNGPERITVNPASSKHVIDLGITETGREFYVDGWGFRRANSKISAGNWVGRGKGNRVTM